MITLILSGETRDIESTVNELRDFDRIAVGVLSQGETAWAISVDPSERKTVANVAADYRVKVREAG